MKRLVGLAGFLWVAVACDARLDSVRVDKGTGALRGWDRSTCECSMEVDAWDILNVALTCSPLFDGKDGYSGYLYVEVPDTYNTPSTELVWSYDGHQGTAVVEVTTETVVDDRFGDRYRAVYVDALYLDEQDACSDHIGGYGDYYLYEVCDGFSGGTLEGVSAWCRETVGGY